jgi:hypothetical protein
MEYVMYGYLLSTLGNWIVIRFRRTDIWEKKKGYRVKKSILFFFNYLHDVHQFSIVAADTYCILHNGKTALSHPPDKYHIPHSDTDSCLHRQTNYTLNTYTDEEKKQHINRKVNTLNLKFCLIKNKI